MKKSAFFYIFTIVGLSALLLAAAGCRSIPEEAPVYFVPLEGDVWSMLARGDDRARDFFTSEVEVNARDSRGRTPLHYAAELKDPSLAGFLLSLGANPNALDNENQSPLGISVERADPAVARILVLAGADIHLPGRNGITVAEKALSSNNVFLRSILTPAGLGSTDSQGRTILHLASIAGSTEAIRTILAASQSYGIHTVD